MSRTLLVFAAAIVVAGLALLLTARTPGEPSAPQIPPRESGLAALEAELEQLRRQLSEEVAARSELELWLAQLQGELQRLAAGDGPAPEPRAEEPGDAEADVAAAGPAEERFNPEVLIEAGFARRDVDAFSRQIDGLEMERLYLRDQATREGWLDSSRYRQESRRISEAQRASRDEFGEQMYDWFLYSTKHPNRVRVEQVFEGSPADQAGLRVGDLIVRYDDRKIFGGQDLRESTVSGRAGDLTPVELERGGEEIRVYVPRGPLGIRMHPTTRKPAPPR